MARPGQRAFVQENLKAIQDHLTVKRAFRLSPDDLSGIASVYQMFFLHGPALRYALDGGRNMPNYADMQTATDLDGRSRAYLSTEEGYAFLRRFQEKNLLVPVVGDFAGPKALRSVAAYLSARGATVTAFYTSNVEQYLFRNAVAADFYRNVATLPVDERSLFVRSAAQRNVIDPIAALLKDFEEGRILSYNDVTSRGTIR